MSFAKKPKTHTEGPKQRKKAGIRAKKAQKPPPKAKQPDQVEKTPGQKVFGSMGAAAAALGVPLRVLKRLKREGKPGFHCSGRVCVDLLLPFLRDHQDEPTAADDQVFALEVRKLVAQCERIEFDNAVARGEYRNAASYNERHLRFGSRVNLLFKLKRNLAPIEVRPLWDKLHGEVMDEMRAAYELEFAEEDKNDECPIGSENCARDSKRDEGAARMPARQAPVPVQSGQTGEVVCAK